MKPLILCILDGVGIRDEKHGNAVYEAKMHNFDKLINNYPHSLLEASSLSVGLPEGQMGNSEVGHTNIGAGRIVYQSLELINKSIETKEIYENKKILDVINHTKNSSSKLHIMGLLSDGGIHSHINHLFCLLDICKKENINQVYLHLYLDGRDTLPTEGLKYLDQLNDKINSINLGIICTISGRYYAMDRDNNYDRIKKSYDAIVYGKGKKFKNYRAAIKYNLKKNITDEFTEPCVLGEGKVDNNDGVIFFNYRPDRLREMGTCLTNSDFADFKTKNLSDLKLITMMPVSEDVNSESVFEHDQLVNTFGEYISSLGLSQLRIAETEKYAHVTYFFDGGVEKDLSLCKRILIPSPKVSTYDLQPEMSAKEITNTLLTEIENYDVIILNFANGDMVGHTGNMEATIKALEVVDECVGRIHDRLQSLGGTLVITADHGNSDYMLDESDNIVTSHSLSPVPFLITDSKYKLKDGKLADIAPTLLSILGLPIPKEMTGEDLIIDSKEMVSKKKGKKIFDYIFIIFSFIFILGLVSFYGGRLIYYYSKANNKVKYQEVSIINKLSSNVATMDESGLYIKDNISYFKGEVKNNYLYFNGLMWRIVSFNDEYVKLISEESLTSLVGVYNGKDYLSIWLDENKDKFYDSNYMIGDFEILSSKEYNESYLQGSYLNNRTNWFTNDNQFVNQKGEINDNVNGKYGVRLVTKIKTDSLIISGDGTVNNYYRIVNENPYNLKDANIGNYVKYGDYVWRIIDKDENKIKLALNDLLDDMVYSNNNNSIFNIKEKGNIGFYLNNIFYDSLNKDKIVLGNFDVIDYSNYDFKKIVNSYDAYVGMLNVGDLFINDFYDYYLNTIDSSNTVYVVKPYSNLYMGFKNSKSKVRPSIYLEDSNIKKGVGTSNDPYVIGD